jgi:hypothetical protein
VSSTANKDLASIFNDDDEMASIKAKPDSDYPGLLDSIMQPFGSRLMGTQAKERDCDDTILTFQDGAKTAQKSFPQFPGAINSPHDDSTAKETRSTGSDSTTSSFSITTKHTMNSRVSHMENNVGNIRDQLSELTSLIRRLGNSGNGHSSVQPPPILPHIAGSDQLAPRDTVTGQVDTPSTGPGEA